MEKRVQIIISNGLETEDINGVIVNKIIEPVLVLGTKFIPTTLSFNITVLIQGYDFINTNNNIKLEVVDENGDVLHSTGDVDIEKSEEAMKNMRIMLDIKNTEFLYEGDYSVIFTINQEKYEHIFSVEQLNKTR